MDELNGYIRKLTEMIELYERYASNSATRWEWLSCIKKVNEYKQLLQWLTDYRKLKTGGDG